MIQSPEFEGAMVKKTRPSKAKRRQIREAAEARSRARERAGDGAYPTFDGVSGKPGDGGVTSR